MTRIKILHVLTTTAGGLGQSVLSIVLRLDPRLFDVAAAFGPGYPLDRKFHESGVRTIPIRMQRGFSPSNFLGLLDLYSLLRRERYEIIHLHGPVAGFLGRLAAKMAGVRLVVYSLHGYPTLNDQRLLNRSLLWLVEGCLDRCTDYYVAISDYTRELWVQRWIRDPERVRTIYHGMDPEESGNLARAEAKTTLGLPETAPVVGAVGLLEERKGTRYLLQAVPTVLASFPECRFVVIGDGPLRPSLERMTEELRVSHRVKFLGWRDDAPELIAAVDVLCHPSTWESFGLVLLEAMARAKPVIASRVGGIPEVVEEGETGILVPPKDPALLAKAILHLLADRETARKMGEKGRLRLMDRFSGAGMVEQYEELYMEAIKNAPRNGSRGSN